MNFSKKKKNNLGLVFDIGSGSVGGAVVEFGEEPKVFYVNRIPLKITSEIRTERLERDILKALKEVLRNLVRDGLKPLHLSDRKNKELKFAHIFLSSPWYLSNLEVLKINKREPFILKKEMLERIIEEESVESSNGEIFEKKILDLKLNGYRVEDPYGKKTKSLELSLFIGEGDRDFLERVKEEIQNEFLIDEFEFHSFLSSFFSTVRDLYPKEEDFLLIDITSEVTDLAIVREGLLYDTASFPKGKNFLVRKISEIFKTPPGEAISSVKTYLNHPKGGKMEILLREAKREFLREFSRTLEEFRRGMSIPKTIFLTADEDLSGWFSKVISEEEYIQGGFSEDKFEIRLINQGQLNPQLSKARGYNKDVFLSIETIFLGKIFDLARF